MKKKKKRSIEALRERLKHYENLIHLSKVKAVPIIRRQIHKLEEQIKELEIKERIDL